MAAAIHFSPESINPYLSQERGNEFQIDLLLKGVKCGHCVHKITKALEDKGLSRWQFGAQGHRLSLWALDKESLISGIDEIEASGFGVIPLDQKNKRVAIQNHFKRELKGLAVAGVCAGNIMLFSTAVYLGASAEFTHFFHKLSLALIVPVFGYSAVPIWNGFFKSFSVRKFNLDFPIGLALIVGMVLSVVSFLGDQNHVYFDSLAMVVFVILSSRFLLGRYVDNLMLRSGYQAVPGVFQVRRIKDGKEELVSADQIEKGETVLVKKGEVIPVDGHLLSSQAIVDNSVLTGESEPVVISNQERIFAGGKICGEGVRIHADSTGEKTRVGRYVSHSLKGQDSQDEEAYSKVNLFTLFVILASLLTFFGVWSFIGFQQAYERAFAIILVACPCAVSFGIPLIRSLSGKLAIQNGLAIKDTGALRQLPKINHIFLDKTGTLTESQIKIEKEDLTQFTETDLEKIVALESQMDHPIGRGIIQASGIINPMFKVDDFRYLPAKGIQGTINEERWEIYGLNYSSKTLQVYKDSQPLGKITLKPTFKKDLKMFLEKLSSQFKTISILSGDQEGQVKKAWNMIPEKSRGVFLSEATPEQKQHVIAEKNGDAVMVGDGINDIASMQKAGLSLCMPGALEDNFQLADVTLLKGDLFSILDVFKVSQKLVSVEKNLMVFTFLYNVICIGLAMAGWISPLAAVILMPISSVCVLAMVALSLRRL